MSNTTTKIPTWFWIVSVAALLWNLVGVFSYLGQAMLTPEGLAELPKGQRVVIETRPAWATGAFAIAVWGGVLGCIFLLLRKSWAVPTLMLSLAGVLVQNFQAYFLSDSIDLLGPEAIPISISIISIGVALIWFARKAQANSWIS
ncbi:MAG: hypothetical protein AAF696_22480 [Bacteroidota bacterium]